MFCLEIHNVNAINIADNAIIVEFSASSMLLLSLLEKSILSLLISANYYYLIFYAFP